MSHEEPADVPVAVALAKSVTVFEMPTEGSGMVVVMVPVANVTEDKPPPMIAKLALATGQALAQSVGIKHRDTRIYHQQVISRLKQLSEFTRPKEEV